MGRPAEIRVEVVYTTPSRQAVKAVRLPAASRIEDAIQASGLLVEFPEIDLRTQQVGIFGEPAALDTVLAEGDRVEIYRALLADPKEARRRRARSTRAG
jgi:hypothetical protein